MALKYVVAAATFAAAVAAPVVKVRSVRRTR